MFIFLLFQVWCPQHPDKFYFVRCEASRAPKQSRHPSILSGPKGAWAELSVSRSRHGHFGRKTMSSGEKQAESRHQPPNARLERGTSIRFNKARWCHRVYPTKAPIRLGQAGPGLLLPSRVDRDVGKSATTPKECGVSTRRKDENHQLPGCALPLEEGRLMHRHEAPPNSN